MTRRQWKTKITKACRDANTYRPFFKHVIDTLSEILERRDEAQQKFEDEGRIYTVEHVTKTGAVNVEQNPLIRLINDLNRDALQYWRDLGLTPAGLKQINETAIKGSEKEPSALEKALKNIEKLG